MSSKAATLYLLGINSTRERWNIGWIHSLSSDAWNATTANWNPNTRKTKGASMQQIGCLTPSEHRTSPTNLFAIRTKLHQVREMYTKIHRLTSSRNLELDANHHHDDIGRVSSNLQTIPFEHNSLRIGLNFATPWINVCSEPLSFPGRYHRLRKPKMLVWPTYNNPVSSHAIGLISVVRLSHNLVKYPRWMFYAPECSASTRVYARLLPVQGWELTKAWGFG